MVNWNSLHNDYSVRYADKIKKVCRPIREQFEISFFGYHQIESNGKYIALNDRPDWGETYIERELYTEDPFLKHPSVYAPGITFFNQIPRNKKSSLSHEWMKKTQMDDAIVLIAKNKTNVEFFIFGSKLQSTHFLKFCFHEWNLLKSFSNYFKKELELILNKQRQEKNRLDIFPESLEVQPKMELSKKLLFLQSIGFQKECEQYGALTLREEECLMLLIKKRSIKAIAVTLNLSPRTVEYYLENAKNKLDCSSINELFSKMQLFIELGLIS